MLEKSFIIGVDHHTSNVDVRQCLSKLSIDELSKKLKVDELYVLSTCNRYEVYVSAPCVYSAKQAMKNLKIIFADAVKLPTSELAGHIYEKSGEDMLRHGFQVASSLESMVLGEPQILGQMKRAYKQSKLQGKMKTNLDKFFNATFHVGKRVRHETVLSSEPVSVASAAVKLAKTVYEYDFTSCNVVLIGAGEMCTAAARHLKSRGVSNITVVNRTLENAKRLSLEVGAKAVRLPKLMSVLKTADVVISCTSSNDLLVSTNMVEDIMANRQDKKLTFIDISVPRNIDEGVNNISNVALYDMDKLGEQISFSKNKRAAEVVHAERIIDEEVISFNKWSEERKNSHMVKHLRSTFEKVRTEVLQGYHSKEAEEATRLMLNKLMHKPTEMIKSGLVPAAGIEMALNLMFDVHCPRIEFVHTETTSVKTGECPFLDVMQFDGFTH